MLVKCSVMGLFSYTRIIGSELGKVGQKQTLIYYYYYFLLIGMGIQSFLQVQVIHN